MNLRLQTVGWWVFAASIVMVAVAASPAALGQDKPKLPFNPADFNPANFNRGQFDPSKFLDQFFGRESDADRKALARIPISTKQEREYGESAIKAFLKQQRQQGLTVLTRGADIEYLRRLVATVRPKMKNHRRYRSITVSLVDSDLTDARSFPGGKLVFFRGMIDYVESEAALIGVIGHELSHLDHGHQLNHIRRMKLAQGRINGGQRVADFRQFFSNGMLLMRTFAKPFHPQDEAEADEDGVRWAYELGYDPREMARVFAKFQQRDPNAQFVPDFIRTHPPHAKRQQAVLDRYNALQQKQPRDKLYVGRVNLKRRITRAQRRFE